ncbi:MAG: hypothetical protein J7L82_06010 [Staphylothermus sp.]|nr:hypothetical protein [Staphylothermus sp.]
MKAISPLVASALLLIMTVAGGLIIYNYMIDALKAPQEYAALSVVSAQMLVSNSTTVINVKVTNIGTAPAQITAVKILSEDKNETINETITIDPGTTKSFNIVINEALEQSIQHYLVLVYNSGDESVSEETEPVPIRLIK